MLDNYMNVCILEHLLADERKTRLLVELLTTLKMCVKSSNDGKSFYIDYIKGA
uniref:Uncharacterized protein n=1 Tax=viral metagenome TaxID=1070528 RepID=A0A6M3JZJ9_9ZZZZ